MSTNEHAHAPRPKFDTLFADPRHYRGDLRLMRTAIRRGWLDDAPQADRDALVARFEEARRQRAQKGYSSEGQRTRAALAEARVLVDMARSNVAQTSRALRACWGGDDSRPPSGRPRTRWHVSDMPTRIDANELRRRAKAEGIDPEALAEHGIDVSVGGDVESARVWIELAVIPDARYGWRLWLVCPGCGCRRRHLYPVGIRLRCRKCAGMAYSS